MLELIALVIKGEVFGEKQTFLANFPFNLTLFQFKIPLNILGIPLGIFIKVEKNHRPRSILLLKEILIEYNYVRTIPLWVITLIFVNIKQVPIYKYRI